MSTSQPQVTVGQTIKIRGRFVTVTKVEVKGDYTIVTGVNKAGNTVTATFC